MQNYRKPVGGYPTDNYGRNPQNVSAGQYRGRQDTPVSIKYERITPIKPTPQPKRPEQMNRRVENPQAQANTTVRDFLFGFMVGLVLFGIAAIIVCSALLKLI